MSIKFQIATKIIMSFFERRSCALLTRIINESQNMNFVGRGE